MYCVCYTVVWMFVIGQWESILQMQFHLAEDCVFFWGGVLFLLICFNHFIVQIHKFLLLREVHLSAPKKNCVFVCCILNAVFIISYHTMSSVVSSRRWTGLYQWLTERNIKKFSRTRTLTMTASSTAAMSSSSSWIVRSPRRCSHRYGKTTAQTYLEILFVGAFLFFLYVVNNMFPKHYSVRKHKQITFSSLHFHSGF